MHITEMSDFFIFSKEYSYNYITILRKYNAIFDKATKIWSVPTKDKTAFLYEVEQFDRNEKLRAKSLWLEACHQHDLEFCKKGTDEYDKVSATFKELIKAK